MFNSMSLGKKELYVYWKVSVKFSLKRAFRLTINNASSCRNGLWGWLCESWNVAVSTSCTTWIHSIVYSTRFLCVGFVGGVVNKCFGKTWVNCISLFPSEKRVVGQRERTQNTIPFFYFFTPFSFSIYFTVSTLFSLITNILLSIPHRNSKRKNTSFFFLFLFSGYFFILLYFTFCLASSSSQKSNSETIDNKYFESLKPDFTREEHEWQNSF